MKHSVNIRNEDCIGCTKCLEACPTDAIFGAQDLLHEVILEDCIGCERCVPVCPTDCIELIPMPDAYDTQKLAEPLKSARVSYVRQLAQEHKARLERCAQEEHDRFERAKNEADARRAYLEILFKKMLNK